MLPSLEPLTASVPVEVPPPHSFRPLRGLVRNARLCSPLRHEESGKRTAAQAAGLRYEDKAQLYLKTVVPYIQSPTFEFFDDSGKRFCQPDGLSFAFNDRPIVFEIKSQHCPEAWWQLRKLYQPVVQAAFQVRKAAVIEVVKSYDPSMPFPEPVTLIEDWNEVLTEPRLTFGVFVWTP